MTASTTATRPVAAKRQRVLAAPVSGQELVLIGVIAVLWILLWRTTPAFFSGSSLQPLLAQVAPVAVIGIGMTMVIVAAGIDVSVAAGIMLCGVVIAKLLVGQGIPLVVAVLVAIAVGAALGLVNGFLIAYGRVHAIIITFGTANIFQFLALRIFNSQTVNGIPSTLGFFGLGGAGRTAGIPHSFVLTVVIAAAVWWYLRHTAGGRHFYAIGGDAAAARLAGINVRGRVLLAYLATGALVGLAAVFTVANGTSTLDQSIGSGQELAVIAATVIGGTSIVGGRGSVLGTILGAILVQTVTSGVTQLNWPSQLSDLFVGVAVIVAVGADLLRQRTRSSR